MKRLSLWTALFVGATGCSLPAIGGRPSAAAPTVHSDAATTDSTAVAAPVVQVRGFSHSAIVTVVAWDADDAEFGLRASVNRAGVLVGGLRFDDHRLYVTPLLARANGGFKYAADTLGHLLLRTGAQRDVYSCFYATDCSPMTTLGVRIPDSLLRANRDSLVVMFFPMVGEPWTLTVRHELIAAYLTKVDSVVAEMRKTGTM
jgi:hypothetical protein